MSEDKLSEEGLREEIKNLLSWGHAHDYDDIIREARADAWEAALDGVDANKIELVDGRYLLGEYPHNPYRKQEEA